MDCPSWSFLSTRSEVAGRACRNRRDGRDGRRVCHPAAFFSREKDWPLLSIRASEFYICALKFHKRELKFCMRAAKFNMRAWKFYIRARKIYIRTCLMYLYAASFILSRKNSLRGQNRTISGGIFSYIFSYFLYMNSKFHYKYAGLFFVQTDHHNSRGCNVRVSARRQLAAQIKFQPRFFRLRLLKDKVRRRRWLIPKTCGNNKAAGRISLFLALLFCSSLSLR